VFGRVGPVNDIFEIDILRINALSNRPPHKRAGRLVKVGQTSPTYQEKGEKKEKKEKKGIKQNLPCPSALRS